MISVRILFRLFTTLNMTDAIAVANAGSSSPELLAFRGPQWGARSRGAPPM